MAAWRNLVGNRGGVTEQIIRALHALLRSLDFILKITENYWGIIEKYSFIMVN